MAFCSSTKSYSVKTTDYWLLPIKRMYRFLTIKRMYRFLPIKCVQVLYILKYVKFFIKKLVQLLQNLGLKLYLHWCLYTLENTLCNIDPREIDKCYIDSWYFKTVVYCKQMVLPLICSLSLEYNSQLLALWLIASCQQCEFYMFLQPLKHLITRTHIMSTYHCLTNSHVVYGLLVWSHSANSEL